MAWRTASPHLHQVNSFSFGPIREVAFLFLGIFATMAPALEIIRHHASSGSFSGIPLDATFFYLGTGLLSAVLDNAPTFLAFLAGLQGTTGLSPRTGQAPGNAPQCYSHVGLIAAAFAVNPDSPLLG